MVWTVSTGHARYWLGCLIRTGSSCLIGIGSNSWAGLDMRIDSASLSSYTYMVEQYNDIWVGRELEYR